MCTPTSSNTYFSSGWQLMGSIFTKSIMFFTNILFLQNKKRCEFNSNFRIKLCWINLRAIHTYASSMVAWYACYAFFPVICVNFPSLAASYALCTFHVCHAWYQHHKYLSFFHDVYIIKFEGIQSFFLHFNATIMKFPFLSAKWMYLCDSEMRLSEMR